MAIAKSCIESDRSIAVTDHSPGKDNIFKFGESLYRAGGKISHTAMMVTLFVTLLLLPVGLIFFQEKLTLFKSLGIILGLVALIFLNI